jgi:hypothetical protein
VSFKKQILTLWNRETNIVRAGYRVVIRYHNDNVLHELGTKVKWFCFELNNKVKKESFVRSYPPVRDRQR